MCRSPAPLCSISPVLLSTQGTRGQKRNSSPGGAGARSPQQPPHRSGHSTRIFKQIWLHSLLTEETPSTGGKHHYTKYEQGSS